MERILADVEKLCFDKELFPIIEKVEKGERLTFEDGMTVMGTEDLNTVGMLADYVKRQRVGDKVYFVVNRHVNPSNICAISCRFCAFGVTKKSANAYELSHDQICSCDYCKTPALPEPSLVISSMPLWILQLRKYFVF